MKPKRFVCGVTQVVVIAIYLIVFLAPEIAKAEVKIIGVDNPTIFLYVDYDIKKDYEYPLIIMNTSGQDQEIYYELADFKTEEGEPIGEVKLFEESEDKPILSYKGMPVSKASSPMPAGVKRNLRLTFSFLKESAKYSGKLNIYSHSEEKNTVDTSTVTLTFERPRKEPPSLVLEVNDGREEPISIRRVSWPIWRTDKAYNIKLENKTKEGSIQNAVIQVSSFTKTQDNEEIDQPFDGDSTSSEVQEIKANSSVITPLSLPEVSKPGTYTVKYDVKANGIEPQAMEVNIKVKYGLWVAISVLVLGSMLSYLLSRFVPLARGHYMVTRTIKSIRKRVEDFRDDNSYLKERIRALADLSSELNSKWFFKSGDKTKEFLDSANYLLEVGERKARVWDGLRKINAPPGLIKEASMHLKEVDLLVARYNVKEFKTEIDAELKEAEKYMNESQGDAYWPKLQEKAKGIIKTINEAGLPDDSRFDHIRELKKELEGHASSAQVEYSHLANIEEWQQKLAFAWKYKDKELGDDCIKKLMEPGMSGLTKVKETIEWKEENDRNWQNIVENAGTSKIRIKPPLDIVENEVGIFTVDFGDDQLNNSYLVRRMLDYKWTFNLSVKRMLRKAKDRPPCFSLAETNSLAKSFPDPGVLNISLGISYDGNSLDIPIEGKDLKDLEVKRNRDIKWINQLSKLDLGVSLVAMFLAILSGLHLKYFNAPEFGSLDDIILLLLWAGALGEGANLPGMMRKINELQTQN